MVMLYINEINNGTVEDDLLEIVHLIVPCHFPSGNFLRILLLIGTGQFPQGQGVVPW